MCRAVYRFQFLCLYWIKSNFSFDLFSSSGLRMLVLYVEGLIVMVEI